MIRALVIAAGAATLLGACTVSSNDPYPSSSRGSYYNPPGYVDFDGNGRDDRVQRDRSYSRYDGGYRYSRGYYDSWGNWHSY